MLPKKTALEGNPAASASSVLKPSYLKNVASNNSAPELLKPKDLMSRFESAQSTNANDGKPPFAKPAKPKPPDLHKDGDSKPAFPKPPLLKPVGALPETKPAFPKPPSALTKPSVTSKFEPKNESASSTGAPASATTPKIPAPLKPKSTFSALKQQPGEAKDESPVAKTPPSSVSGVKQSSFRAAQNLFNKAEEAAKEDSRSPSGKESPGPAPRAIPKKPSYKGKPDPSDDPSAPKRNPLPNILALGSPPSKPNRPPRVNIEKFKKATETSGDVSEIKKPVPPPPPASHPVSQPAPALPPALPPILPPTLPPSLPPRPTGPSSQGEDEYDDVGNSGQQLEDGEEMYEELDCSGPAGVKEQEKKREKEDKKRAEQEKKEQKERERKEQEARKKFKLTGPLQVIHKGTARVDCRGMKNDLSLKQGDSIEIIRVTDNPEERWLARSQDGSYGFVKISSILIDTDSLKKKVQPPSITDGDVYDDVGSHEEAGRSSSGPGVVLPPPPEGDVYDEVDNPNLNISPEFRLHPKPLSFLRRVKAPPERRKSPVSSDQVPPPPQFSPEGNSAPGDQDVYDDVGTFPSPPPISSMPKQVKHDSKMQKKFEKEEKDFRKKFKYDGEIQVQYSVTVENSKKGSGKDLTVQAGETLDVISSSDPDKLICRNKDGKFGYVLTSCIQSEDNDIYVDVENDCIYDND